MSIHPFRLAELTRDEVRERAATSTAIVPLGSTEQHGRHLPVSVDTALVHTIAERAARRAAATVPVVLAPTLPYGFAHHHLGFAGTISIPAPVYVDVLTEIGASLAASGFRRLVFLNGHGGNQSPCRAAADRLVYERRLPMDVASGAYWDLAADALASANLQVGPVPGHAGGFETSCLLAAHPELVHLDRRPAPEAELQPLVGSELPGAYVRRHGIWERSDGRSDDAQAADPSEGERILEFVVGSVADFIVTFHQSVEQ